MCLSLFTRASLRVRARFNTTREQELVVKCFADIKSFQARQDRWSDLVTAVSTFLKLRRDAGADDVISIVLFNSTARTVCTMMPLSECVCNAQF